MKKLVLLFTCIVLAGCERSVNQLDYPMPTELYGCKVFMLKNGTGGTMKVVHCPSLECTSTEYMSGKVKKTEAMCK